MQMVELQSSLGGQALYKFRARDIQKKMAKKKAFQGAQNQRNSFGWLHVGKKVALPWVCPGVCAPAECSRYCPILSLLQQLFQAPLSPITRREGNAESQASPDVNQAADDKQTTSICAIDTKQKISSQIQQLRSKGSLSTPGSPLQRPSHWCCPWSRDLPLSCPLPLSRVTFGLGWDTDCQ